MKPYYKDEYVTIYHGDCRQIVPMLGRFDLLLTDPPYGIKMDKGFGCGGLDGFGKRIPRSPTRYEGSWDSARPERVTFEVILQACSAAIVWGGNYFADLLSQSTHWLVWDKQQTMPTYSDCELAWTNIKKQSVKRLVYASNGMLSGEKARYHPTQKPLPVMNWSMQMAGEFQTVLDPFAGSGTTGRAAKDAGKQCVLIEREERYCEISARRCAQEVLGI